MKRSSKSSKPSFPAPQGDGNLSSDRPSAKTFNKKRFWTVIAIVAVIEVLAIALVQQWRYIFPSHEVSEIYTRYENTDGIDASFIKDFRVNDSVFIDVTLLEAIDSTGWDILKRDFEVASLPPELQQLVDNGEDLVFTKSIPKSEMDKSDFPNDLLAISHMIHTVTVFHINSEIEKYAVLNHNYKEEIIN